MRYLRDLLGHVVKRVMLFPTDIYARGAIPQPLPETCGLSCLSTKTVVGRSWDCTGIAATRVCEGTGERHG